MTWLASNWKWIALLVLVRLVLFERSQYGERRYEDGKTAERNTNNASVEEARAETQKVEGQQRTKDNTHETELVTQRQDLTAASNGRIRQLEKQLATTLRAQFDGRVCNDRGAESAGVPTVPGSAAKSDDSTRGEGSASGNARAIAERAARAAAYAGRCEQDRLTVLGWQRRAQEIKEAMAQLE